MKDILGVSLEFALFVRYFESGALGVFVTQAVR